MNETDTKTKYIDITQLPVAPESDSMETTIRMEMRARMDEFYTEMLAAAYALPTSALENHPLTFSTMQEMLAKMPTMRVTGLCTPNRNYSFTNWLPSE